MFPPTTAGLSRKPLTAYIALGSNLGQREESLRQALHYLSQTQGVEIRQVSTFHEYPAVGGPADSPPFLNAAAELTASLDARPLLDRLLEIERQLGRQRREKWGPRTIDLDLLLFDDRIINEPRLVVPHPLMHERRFVLEPLAEIAPHVRHPVLKQTITQLLSAH